MNHESLEKALDELKELRIEIDKLDGELTVINDNLRRSAIEWCKGKGRSKKRACLRKAFFKSGMYIKF